jgi:lipopolysaccharide cholinephosphotransferase
MTHSLIQDVELEALKEIQAICAKNGIKFYMRGGSVMGAIKYKGFIPWDDDMDIAIPRPDFEKFVSVFSQDWSDKFWMASYRNGDQIHAYFPRILIKEKFRKSVNLPSNNHLGFSIIDVLPLDGVPSSAFGRKLFKYHVAAYRALGAVWTLDVKDTIMIHKAKRQRAIKLLASTGIKHLYSQNAVYRKLEHIYSKRPYTAAWSGTITGSLFDKEMFPTRVWGAGKLVPFEDITVRVPSEFDMYLKQLYGKNYASYEPEDKKSHLIDKRIED